MNAIEVVIIEDSFEYRNTLKLILNGTPGFTCKFAYANGESAMEELLNYHPDIILVDLGLPGISGIECIRELKKRFSSLLFLVLTISDEDDNIFEALTVGANGYLLKDATPSKILDSIRELYDGGAPMSTQIARKVVSHFHSPRKKNSLITESGLTRREKEVLELLATGLLYKQIAGNLNISLETVKCHCHSIYKKLHVNTRTEALLKYLQSNNDPTR